MGWWAGACTRYTSGNQKMRIWEALRIYGMFERVRICLWSFEDGTECDFLVVVVTTNRCSSKLVAMRLAV